MLIRLTGHCRGFLDFLRDLALVVGLEMRNAILGEGPMVMGLVICGAEHDAGLPAILEDHGAERQGGAKELTPSISYYTFRPASPFYQ
jgi:hypothetical protein